jgi:hypothetical protein
MLVQSYYNRNRGRVPLQDRVELQKVTDAAVAGIEVEVLVAGIYNGPGHKALPRAEAGDLIRVAGGPYLEGLIASNRLRLPGQAVEPVAPELTFGTATAGSGETSPLFDAESAPVDDYAFLLDAGLTERQAKLVFGAGFTSKLAIQQSVAAAGLEGLTSIKGIGQQTAQQVADWANQEG